MSLNGRIERLEREAEKTQPPEVPPYLCFATQEDYSAAVAEGQRTGKPLASRIYIDVDIDRI